MVLNWSAGVLIQGWTKKVGLLARKQIDQVKQKNKKNENKEVAVNDFLPAAETVSWSKIPELVFFVLDLLFKGSDILKVTGWLGFRIVVSGSSNHRTRLKSTSARDLLPIGDGDSGAFARDLPPIVMVTVVHLTAVDQD
ncbi:hypothetical protein E3N88_09559 [Mikania micrantha]|uniref:Uncharacterized protein n=1 Tax=Mikania micrantha TaxID=192012 RepID=A0A5N6PLP0_9ASTR|nr:hypothetical protein E3N88_09559 [Mikania micrantha]